jgi:hypothetical protein
MVDSSWARTRIPPGRLYSRSLARAPTRSKAFRKYMSEQDDTPAAIWYAVSQRLTVPARVRQRERSVRSCGDGDLPFDS